ncbi:uncharacterized protein JCM15063_000660, partial [Sporobolomyces koalae]|uniref:uncharacterized protein n=1 Tax=Sporobolomyces koalae TaxID=500713 RepID=UPI0031705A7C
STLALALVALAPLALASPVNVKSPQGVEKRGFGGLGYGYGGYGFPRNRFFKERFRKHKNKALLAAERKNRLNLDKDTALAAKNFKEVNFGAEKDRKFDNADIRKAKLADIAKDKAFRKNIRVGESGGFWKRQSEDEQGLGFGGGGYGFGGFDDGFGGYEGGFGGYEGGFGGFDGGIGGGGFDFLGNQGAGRTTNAATSSSTARD